MQWADVARAAAGGSGGGSEACALLYAVTPAPVTSGRVAIATRLKRKERKELTEAAAATAAATAASTAATSEAEQLNQRPKRGGAPAIPAADWRDALPALTAKAAEDAAAADVALALTPALPRAITAALRAHLVRARLGDRPAAEKRGEFVHAIGLQHLPQPAHAVCARRVADKAAFEARSAFAAAGQGVAWLYGDEPLTARERRAIAIYGSVEILQRVFLATARAIVDAVHEQGEAFVLLEPADMQRLSDKLKPSPNLDSASRVYLLLTRGGRRAGSALLVLVHGGQRRAVERARLRDNARAAPDDARAAGRLRRADRAAATRV